MAWYGNSEKYENLGSTSFTNGKIVELQKIIEDKISKGATDFEYTNSNGDPCGNYEFLRFYREIPEEEIKEKKRQALLKELKELDSWKQT